MNKKIPNSTKVVVIGGGVVGCSCAYHLAKFGWKDVILLERDKLTSGTTWHAAGLVSQLGPSATITKIRKYSLDLYKELEKKVDHSAGLRLNGAMSIAQEEGRWQELKRQATTAQLYDVNVQILNKDEIKDKVPEDFSFGEFPENFEHFEPYLTACMKRFPILEKVGIRKFFAGPESFTPDTNTLLGEVPEVKNIFVCCGLNSIGIASAGGVGKLTAEWMMNGHINEDIFSYDIKRFQKFHSDINFIKERITETLGDLYGMHWPYKQHKTSRDVITLPYHDELKKHGACFGVSGGYERPMWFSKDDKNKDYKYSYNYQNWYPSAEYESINTRKNVGLFELSPFSKFELTGERVHQELQRLCTANISNEPGKIKYTQMLNKDGGIEADLTVICLDKNNYRIISSAANREHDKFHILKNISEDINFKDVTEDYCCLGLFGPKSRELINSISKDDLSSKKFKFSTAKFININNLKVWAQRISYVGELGYELYVERDLAKKLFNTLIESGSKYNLSLCGMHAMDIMRMESGFVHWGHDISPEENQFEAGLSFAISFKKNINFIGRDVLEKIKDKKVEKSLKILTLENSKPGEPLLLHDEPIYHNNKIVGRTTSGCFSFNFNKNISYGYINSGMTSDQIENSNFEIEVEKKKYRATVLKKPLNSKNIFTV